MNTLKEGAAIDSSYYAKLLGRYYSENKQTNEIHIDTLILLYRLTGCQKCFSLLFECHYYLLLKILRKSYNKYKGFLYGEDYNELQQMLYCEFFRRVIFYKIPPEAPFSKYVKLYLKKWLNVYVKIMVNKNKRFILMVDYHDI